MAKRLDIALVLSGFGSWAFFFFSLVSSHLWVLQSPEWLQIPTSTANLLFLVAAFLALAATVLLVVRLVRLHMASAPLLAGLAGASLVTALITLALLNWFAHHA
jgi:hypothetical protein